MGRGVDRQPGPVLTRRQLVTPARSAAAQGGAHECTHQRAVVRGPADRRRGRLRPGALGPIDQIRTRTCLERPRRASTHRPSGAARNGDTDGVRLGQPAHCSTTRANASKDARPAAALRRSVQVAATALRVRPVGMRSACQACSRFDSSAALRRTLLQWTGESAIGVPQCRHRRGVHEIVKGRRRVPYRSDQSTSVGRPGRVIQLPWRQLSAGHVWVNPHAVNAAPRAERGSARQPRLRPPAAAMPSGVGERVWSRAPDASRSRATCRRTRVVTPSRPHSTPRHAWPEWSGGLDAYVCLVVAR